MPYKCEQTTDHGVPVVRLTDSDHGMEVSVIPSVGNVAYEIKSHGNNILYFPYPDVSAFQKSPVLSGVPFLAPWANRLDQQGFWANGRINRFNMGLGNVQGEIPIHGLLTSSPYWEVADAEADGDSAWVTSRLEFHQYPELIAQWPIQHQYEMTYRLVRGMLEITATLTNLSTEPMPVAIGFHPYFRIPGVRRDDWEARIPARQRVITDYRLIPTGEYTRTDLNDPFRLEGRSFDDGFTDLIRDEDDLAHFSLASNGKRIDVLFGPKYQAAVVFSPQMVNGEPREFICFEPMAGITNALNLNQEGKYPDLQEVAPGASWTESFWVRARGFETSQR